MVPFLANREQRETQVPNIKINPGKVKPADTIKPACAKLKLTPSEFQVWAAKARGWVQQSNFLANDINVQHLYMTSMLDKETQQKVEAMPEYAMANASEVLQLVERGHDTANPLFVKRSNFFGAYRGPNKANYAYIARVKILGDLAKLSEMDEPELVKFKVLRDLQARIREKVLLKPDMDLNALTKLVTDHEVIELNNASLKAEPARLPKPVKAKEEAMSAAERGKKFAEKTRKPRNKLPDEAYKGGCWCCGAEHSRSECKADKSNMVCQLCGLEKSHVTAVCLKQWDDQEAPAGQPRGRPATRGRSTEWCRWRRSKGHMHMKHHCSLLPSSLLPPSTAIQASQRVGRAGSKTWPWPSCHPSGHFILTWLNGPSSTLGEAYVWLQVAGFEMKERVRTIVVDDLPEGQEMLLGCRNLKICLINPQFPKPYVEVRDRLRLPPVTYRHKGRIHGGGDTLRKMEDAFTTSELDSEPLTIDKTLFRHQEDDNVDDIPGLSKMPAIIRETLLRNRSVFANKLSAFRKIKCDPLHLQVRAGVASKVP